MLLVEVVGRAWFLGLGTVVIEIVVLKEWLMWLPGMAWGRLSITPSQWEPLPVDTLHGISYRICWP